MIATQKPDPIQGAIHALRSYQYGNSSPFLAEEAADALEAWFKKHINVAAVAPDPLTHCQCCGQPLNSPKSG